MRDGFRHAAFLSGVFLCAFCVIIIARPVLASCFTATAVAYLLNPIVNKLEQSGTPRSVSSFLIIFAAACMLCGVVVFLTPVLYSQALGIIKLLMDKVPFIDLDEIMNSISMGNSVLDDDLEAPYSGPMEFITENLLSKSSDDLLKFFRETYRYFGKLIAGIATSSVGIGNYIVKVFISFLLSFYILWHWPVIVKNIMLLIPKRYVKNFSSFMAMVDDIVSSYLRGQLTVCIIMSCYYCGCFVAVGLEYSLIVGFISGLMIFIPYIGPIFSVVLGICVALYQDMGTTSMTIVAAIFIVGHVLEAHVITPAIIGTKLHMSPAWLVIGMVVLTYHAGFLGALLSFPLTAILGVLVQDAVKRYLNSGFYLGK
ncbi:AI-2E family transporter [Anaplasma bovis]|uniref:AI-2E family transporter n=1 Tax=Anaplasma bovis TaxID=186733 RepID=UPI002FEE9950